MRIVIVEDEMAIREGLAHMINQNTSHVVVAKCQNGKEGLDTILRMKPDCVITDIRMSQMSGLEMLTELHEQEVMPPSIIISGYAEFEYAREGIRLGIEEYLLKPISIDALEEALHAVEDKLAENRNVFGNRSENYIRAYFFGTAKEQEEAKSKLVKMFPENGKKWGIFAGNYRNAEKELDKIEYLLRHIKRQYPEYAYADAIESQLHLRILIVRAQEEEIQAFANDFEEMVIRDWTVSKYEIPWAMNICSSVEEWQDSFQEIKRAMAYCLSEGCYKLQCAKEIGQRRTKELVYPFHIEKKLLAALGIGEKEQTREFLDDFLKYVFRKEYDAEDIRQALLKLVTRMLDVAREINQKAYEILRTKNLMQNILMAYTRIEIVEIFYQMGDIICEKEKRGGISNYTINRTVEYIRMHFHEGISLEGTAEALNITPEYLSMLFKREMGMNFSVFLKEFRISHAKRLLKETDMKVYEVAEACGYNNSNYFTKVFKEVTGILPADYR